LSPVHAGKLRVERRKTFQDVLARERRQRAIGAIAVSTGRGIAPPRLGYE